MVERVKAGTPADTLEGQRLEFKTGSSVRDELTNTPKLRRALRTQTAGSSSWVSAIDRVVPMPSSGLSQRSTGLFAILSTL